MFKRKTQKSFKGRTETTRKDTYWLGSTKCFVVDEGGDIEVALGRDEIVGILTLWDDDIFEDFVRSAREARNTAREQGKVFKTPKYSLDPDFEEEGEEDEEDEEDDDYL